MSVAPGRDAVVGAPPTDLRVPPGGALARCADCGAGVLLEARGISELGRRPSAVVLCPPCAAPKPKKKGIIDRMVDAARGGGAMEDAMAQLLQESVTPDVGTYFSFEPTEVADEVQGTVRELKDRWTWEWINATDAPVLIMHLMPPPNDRQVMLLPGESFHAELPKPGVVPYPRRPVRDDPQA